MQRVSRSRTAFFSGKRYCLLGSLGVWGGPLWWATGDQHLSRYSGSQGQLLDLLLSNRVPSDGDDQRASCKYLLSSKTGQVTITLNSTSRRANWIYNVSWNFPLFRQHVEHGSFHACNIQDINTILPLLPLKCAREGSLTPPHLCSVLWWFSPPKAGPLPVFPILVTCHSILTIWKLRRHLWSSLPLVSELICFHFHCCHHGLVPTHNTGPG